jgi:hypothetical protein
MNENNQERRILVLMVLFALWVSALGFSFYIYFTTPDKVAATVPGLSRTIGLIGWQGVAGMFAIGCWGVGWSFPRGSGIRRMSVLPLSITVLLALVTSGVAFFGSD